MKLVGMIRLLITAWVCLCLSALPAEAGKWWKARWPYRCGVTFDQKNKPATGKEPTPPVKDGYDVGVVTIRTSTFARKDGGDIRVVTTRGKDMPLRVLRVGPGDEVTVAFALEWDVPRYDVYFGNPQAAAAAPLKPLDLRRGALLEMWHYAGGHARNLKEARNALNRAKKKGLIARGFRDRIFLGFNPFGPQTKIAAVWTAFFPVPRDGEYRFGLSSRNASFLLVNDKPLVNHGRWHGPSRRVRATGKIALKKGLNKITLYHVSPWSDPVISLVWLPPGEKRWAFMPPAAFSPVAKGKAGPIECYGRGVNADLTVTAAGETFLQNRYYQRRIFQTVVTGPAGRKLTWRWDLGDGQKAAGDKVEHVYLKDGTYTVKLVGRGYLRPLQMTHRVAVTRQWDKVTSNKLDKVRDYAKIVKGYDFAALDPRSNMEAVLLFRRAGDFASMLRACEVFVKRTRAGGKEIQTVLPIYVKSLLDKNKPAAAADALLKAATMATVPAVAAEMIVKAGYVKLDSMEDPAAAGKLFQRVLSEYQKRASASVLRRATIGLGDVWRAEGDYDKARRVYEAAGITDKRAKSFRAIVKGDFARQVEEYLRRKDHTTAAETLDKWEFTMPADRLEGYSTLLRARLNLARKQYADAAREAEVLVKVNPSGTYAPELLMLAAEAYRKNKQPDKAKRALQRIVKNYRESPALREAVKILKADADKDKDKVTGKKKNP